jgi:hypothetical protein
MSSAHVGVRATAQGRSRARAQVVRRQSDGTWLRAIDQPEFRRVAAAG